ncbi:MAG TPA: DUF4293 domain-containing protein [Flavitalea sp.]|nr:DUF4293 domain-containing protein [Flavitalea sp.]
MIQRIQSIWLFLAAVCAFVAYLLALYVGKIADNTEKPLLMGENLGLVVILIGTGLLALVTIFLYKNRKLQFRLSVLGALLSIGIIALEYFFVESFKKQYQIVSGTYQLGALLPILMVLLFIFACRGMYRDEKLVKSVDRLR